MPKKKVIVFLVVLLSITAVVWLSLSATDQPVAEKEIPSSEAQIFVAQSKKVVLTIDNGTEEAKTFEAEFNEGMTAFDLLQEAERQGLPLEIKTFDIGVLVEAIGETQNGESGKYWLYYVNGEMAPVAVDKNKLGKGDMVEFKFEKSPF